MLLIPSLYEPFWCLIPLLLLVAVISFFAIAMRANQWLYKPGLHSFGTTVPDMDGSAGAIGSVAGTCELVGISGTVVSAGCGVTAGVSG